MLTITWNKKSETSLFLASAQKDNGTLSVTYLTESLQTKYQVKQDYELEILNVVMQDSSDYTCQVIKFLDESRGAIDERFQNTTSLLVQGNFKWLLRSHFLKSSYFYISEYETRFNGSICLEQRVMGYCLSH